jgi:hypothetical protein
MSTKLGRVLLLCDQALLDMRQLTNKVTTLEQCYVGEGVDGHTGTADLSDTEVALIQQVRYLAMRPSFVLQGIAVMAAGRQISLHMSVTTALCAASPVCVQATSNSCDSVRVAFVCSRAPVFSAQHTTWAEPTASASFAFAVCLAPTSCTLRLQFFSSTRHFPLSGSAGHFRHSSLHLCHRRWTE